ncbi:unnamed protein product [Ectocarpus sp. 6 AP-2014]
MYRGAQQRGGRVPRGVAVHSRCPRGPRCCDVPSASGLLIQQTPGAPSDGGMAPWPPPN